jgi:hypothetical protein
MLSTNSIFSQEELTAARRWEARVSAARVPAVALTAAKYQLHAIQYQFQYYKLKYK